MFRLHEAIENPREDRRIDTNPRVADRDFDVRLHALELETDRPALRRELQGVGQQVPDDLLETAGIREQRWRTPVKRFRDRDLLRFNLWLNRVEGRITDLRQVNLLPLELELARDDPRDIEQIVDQLQLKVRVTLDDREGVREPLPIDRSGAQNSQPSQDCVQWGAELMGQRREELVFGQVRSLGFGPRLLFTLQQLVAFFL
jgi:hypothetical protein